MESVLETLVTLVGIMLILALVAQSTQEVIKTAFAIKGRVNLRALRGLVREAAQAGGEQMPTDGDEIFSEVVKRLQALGQKGFGKKGIRLDALGAGQLSDLIAHVNPAKVSGLRALDDETAQQRLLDIGEQACRWHALAMNPTSDRYRRRMRALALVTSAGVVLSVNANIFHLVDVVRADPNLRAQTLARDSVVMASDTTVTRLTDSLAVLTAGTDTALRPVISTVSQQLRTAVATRDSVASAATADLSKILGGNWETSDPLWWLGILLSTMLVSLGAPFWHDVLGAVLRLKLGSPVQQAGGTSPPETAGSAMPTTTRGKPAQAPTAPK